MSGPQRRIRLTVNEDLLNQYETIHKAVYRIYEPEGISIVMGAGRRGQRDLVDHAIAADRIPVLMRKGGGGTVVLSPGMAVLALVTEVSSPYQNREYARRINTWIADSLGSLGVENLQQRGVSDLALGEAKIAGTSIFRRRRILFYQVSLLINNDIDLFGRYLTYPSRVPDYREGRPHADFCTNLAKMGYSVTVDQVCRALETVVSARLPELL